MAERRMFAKTIIDSDAFIEMPMSARLLYYDLSMRADDDGFVNSPKKIMKMIGASTDDMNILILRKFVLAFDNGVIVIKHWRVNNYLRSDRYKETNYIEQKQQLTCDEKGIYHLNNSVGIPTGIPVVDTGKDSIGYSKDNIDNIPSPKVKKTKYGQYQHVLLSDEQLLKLKEEYPADWLKLITYLDEYIEMKGYKAKNHYLAIKKWVVDAVKRENNKIPDFTVKKERKMSKEDEELYRKVFGTES